VPVRASELRADRSGKSMSEAPVSHTPELYTVVLPFSFMIILPPSSPHLHRIIIHPTPRSPAQDDRGQIEDRPTLTATCPIPFLRLSLPSFQTLDNDDHLLLQRHDI